LIEHVSVRRIGALRAPWGWIDRHASPIFGVFALIAFVGLLYLGRKGTFFQDEWAFIQIGGLGTVRDWFAPHNEHWSTVPFALYRALLGLVRGTPRLRPVPGASSAM